MQFTKGAIQAIEVKRAPYTLELGAFLKGKIEKKQKEEIVSVVHEFTEYDTTKEKLMSFPGMTWAH
jgi:hypothetical protein